MRRCSARGALALAAAMATCGTQGGARLGSQAFVGVAFLGVVSASRGGENAGPPRAIVEAEAVHVEEEEAVRKVWHPFIPHLPVVTRRVICDTLLEDATYSSHSGVQWARVYLDSPLRRLYPCSSHQWERCAVCGLPPSAHPSLPQWQLPTLQLAPRPSSDLQAHLAALAVSQPPNSPLASVPCTELLRRRFPVLASLNRNATIDNGETGTALDSESPTKSKNQRRREAQQGVATAGEGGFQQGERAAPSGILDSLAELSYIHGALTLAYAERDANRRVKAAMAPESVGGPEESQQK